MAHILLDTHIILYALAEPECLSKKTRDFISDSENSVFFSPLSIWEIAIKHEKHPEDMPICADETLEYCMAAGYRELSLTANDACLLASLDTVASGPTHKDPFDRMLICQALGNDMQLLTRDSDILAYGFENVIEA